MPQHHLHSFHIPVMGLAFTIDTPIKVAHYGISSVVSIVDDILIEGMRSYYYPAFGEEYIPIGSGEYDYRARRIADYLTLMDRIAASSFKSLQRLSFGNPELDKYFRMLPEDSDLKRVFHEMENEIDKDRKRELQKWLREQMKPGAIDVNIMTKLDKINYADRRTALPQEFSDALAALRGFVRSSLNSSVVMSAGMNPRLYAYLEEFREFYPDADGLLRKKVTLKVSDFRSASIQSRFLAKKGIFTSEFRIESGLNCGGHAFATEGQLMGPILEEFREKRESLYTEMLELCHQYWRQHGMPAVRPGLRISAQGGVGTEQEHRFLIERYGLDSVGWGSPFLLVPEATTVDSDTMLDLAKSGAENFYLSNASPLGVTFNNFRLASSERLREKRIAEGRPGSPCTKKYLISNTEFTTEPICIASRKYQNFKIRELESRMLPPSEYKRQFESIVEKNCLCEGLASSALINYDIRVKEQKNRAVTICPGPNIAYFSKIASLEEMVGHIYGRTDLLEGVDRSHMFINELRMYVDYLTHETQKFPSAGYTNRQRNYLVNFRTSLLSSIDYYRTALRGSFRNNADEDRFLRELTLEEERLQHIGIPEPLTA